MPVFLTVDDLLVFAPGMDRDKAEAMILGATATALLKAKCLADLDPENADDATKIEVVKAILVQAILRWDTEGSGAAVTQSAGPYGLTIDNRQRRYGMFNEDEIQNLAALCGGSRGAFAIDTTPAGAPVWEHAPTCSVNFGQSGWCTCGADINDGQPLWG